MGNFQDQKYATPTIIVAGLYVEELVALRELLDIAGGNEIVMVCCRPSLLDKPVSMVIAEGEPAWDQPAPEDWIDGGGFGRRPTMLFSGMTKPARQLLEEILHKTPIGPLLRILELTKEEDNVPLGKVLAKAKKLNVEVEILEENEIDDELPPEEVLLPGGEALLDEISEAEAEEKETEIANGAVGFALEDLPLDLIDRLAALNDS